MQASYGVVFVPIKDRLVLSMIWAEANPFVLKTLYVQTLSLLIGIEGNVPFGNPLTRACFCKCSLKYIFERYEENLRKKHSL